MRESILYLFAAVCGAVLASADAAPPDALVEAVRQEFLALPRPLEYNCTVTYNFFSGDTAQFGLKGTTKTFAESHAVPELVYALWPFMDGSDGRDAEAVIVLMGKLSGLDFVGESLTFQDAANVGNWPKFRDFWIHSCKVDAKDALGKLLHDGWYPHRVLFDPATVLAESVDPALRAQHVAALRAALRDPALRTENPLGVEDVVGLLCQLDAKEAAPDVAPYFLYSWRQRGTFRATPGSLEIGPELLSVQGTREVGAECLALSFLAQDVGKSCVPLVLAQYASATAEDRLVAAGGGCAPLFFLHYAVLAGFSRSEAVATIDTYMQGNPGLPPEQATALAELRMIVQSGQYQTDASFFGLSPGWDAIPAP